MPKNTKNVEVSLVYYIKRSDGKPCNHTDAETFDQIMCDDDILRFDTPHLKPVHDVYDTPENLGDWVVLAFHVRFKKNDDTHRSLLERVQDHAKLDLPEGYEIHRADIELVGGDPNDVTISRKEYNALLDAVEWRAVNIQDGCCDGESLAYQRRQELKVELAYEVLEKLKHLIKKK